MTDFDRFRLRNARMIRSKITTNSFLYLKKQSKKSKKTEVKGGAKEKKAPAKKVEKKK